MRCIALSLFIFSSPAALALTPQLSVSGAATTKVSGTNHLDVGAFASTLVIPSRGPIYFTYAGPGLQVTDGWWTSPRIGMELGLVDEDDARPVFSLWNGFKSRSGRISAFVETEVYPDLSGSPSPMIYYGFYAVDSHLGDLSFGAHVEQVDFSLAAGPHVGYKMGGLQAALQYFYSFGNGDALRVTIGANL